MRKVALVNNEFYHIFNRSIAGFKIFNRDSDYRRFIDILRFYQTSTQVTKYSVFKRLNIKTQSDILDAIIDSPRLVSIVCFCLMPTHFHLILKQEIENGISKFIKIIEDSYSRYFNIAHKRKGPLWESRFKSVHIEIDEQLLHLTRYIHLNPTSAGLVKKPQEWEYSSYQEYLNKREKERICDFKKIIDMSPNGYKEFVNNRKNYQKELSIIKSQMIDSYTG